MADPPGAPQLGALKQAEIECDNLIQTLAGDFENEIGALLDTVANPLSSSRFQQSYLAKFNEKIQAFGYSSVQYPEETIRKYERNLIKLIHLRFLDNATRKEAAPLIQKGLDDPSSYLWDKIRENRNDVKMTVGNYFYNFVAPTLVRQPDLIVEIRNISEDQVNEVFKEIVTNFADDLFLSTNFDSQFDKVTWFDRLSFGLFANVKDKYAKACKYVMDLVANISNYQMDPNRPVVLFDKTQIDAMTRSLKAHADARKRRALDKRTEKRLTALNVGVGISVGALVIIGAVVAINLPLAIGAAFLSALTCLAFNIEIFTQVIIRWYSKNRKAIKRTTMDLFSGLSNMLSSSGAPKSLTFP